MIAAASFSNFIRSGGNSSFILTRNVRPLFVETKQVPLEAEEQLVGFLVDLNQLADENHAMLQSVLRGSPSAGDRHHNIPDVRGQINHALQTFRSAVVAAHHYYRSAIGDPSKRADAIESDIHKTRVWLLREFRETINQFRQIAVSVTHYIWRSSDDAKVRTSHAQRDDRIFSWSHQHSDGNPSIGFGCRCHAEPAIVDNQIFLAHVDISADFDVQVNQAIVRGGSAAAVDIVEATGSTFRSVTRFIALGLGEIDGSNSPEDQDEFENTLLELLKGVVALKDFDLEAQKALIREFGAHLDERETAHRLLDREFRLGLVSERVYLQDVEDISYLRTNLAAGVISLSAGLAKLGISLTKRSAGTVVARMRTRRIGLEKDNRTRQAELNRIINARYAELERQGHGPQRHDGDVTRQMLEDRVLLGIDPMTGTTTDALNGKRHRKIRFATRIISKDDFVSAESAIRKSPEYRAARETALHGLGPKKTSFTVIVMIEDALGSLYASKVEDVRRLGSVKNSTGIENIDFDRGLVKAVFDLSVNGEPRLVTLFPIGG